MTVELFLDSPNLADYQRHKPILAGGTTNPSLMSKAGVKPEQYEQHARKILEVLDGGVLSVEVTGILPAEMQPQALKFAAWDKRIVVKIPAPFYLDLATAAKTSSSPLPLEKQIASTPLNASTKIEGNLLFVDTLPLIKSLAAQGVSLNVTCGYSFESAHDVASAISAGAKQAGPAKAAKHNYYSIFWGRMLDKYAADPKLAISKSYDQASLEKLLAIINKEVSEAAKELEGSPVRLIIASCRLPRAWEDAAKKQDAQVKPATPSASKLKFLNVQAYRAVLQAAAPFNAVPTVPPALLEAARFNDDTAIAVKGFIDDLQKLGK